MARGLAPLAAMGMLIVLAAGVASAERSQTGNLIVSLDGGISPLALPRDRLAPVALHFSGSLRTADGSTLPRVTRMELSLAGRGEVFTRGLPVCTIRRLHHTRNREALAACAKALVGRGELEARILVPGQPQFSIHAQLLLFNGRSSDGHTTLLLHGYAESPPTVVVVPFVLHKDRGRFRNTLVASLPRALGPWPRVASFEMTFFRRFRYRGIEHGFLNASCPVPPRFTAGFLSFARISYALADGRHAGTEIVRSCRGR